MGLSFNLKGDSLTNAQISNTFVANISSCANCGVWILWKHFVSQINSLSISLTWYQDIQISGSPLWTWINQGTQNCSIKKWSIILPLVIHHVAGEEEIGGSFHCFCLAKSSLRHCRKFSLQSHFHRFLCVSHILFPEVTAFYSKGTRTDIVPKSHPL